MGNYENGAFTRQVIVDACKKLFYEKGFHETSYSDICKEAHVNRSTIYYHFSNKELMRLEVLWEFFIKAKHIAETYCPETAYTGAIAMGILWTQTEKDENMRRYFRQLCLDFPIYTAKQDSSYFYFTAHDYMWKDFLSQPDIPSITFTTVYGYIMSCMLLLCEHPENYNGWDFFRYCSSSCLYICGLTECQSEEILSKAEQYFKTIPSELLTVYG